MLVIRVNFNYKAKQSNVSFGLYLELKQKKLLTLYILMSWVRQYFACQR